MSQVTDAMLSTAIGAAAKSVDDQDHEWMVGDGEPGETLLTAPDGNYISLDMVLHAALEAILPLIDPAGGGEGKADADVDNWDGRPTPAEASALLRRYADKINLPPNDNNFADAAAVIDRLLVMVRAQNKYIAALTLPPSSDSEKLIEAAQPVAVSVIAFLLDRAGEVHDSGMVAPTVKEHDDLFEEASVLARAAQYLEASPHPLAKHMPSRERLKEQIGADPEDVETEVRPADLHETAVSELRVLKRTLEMQANIMRDARRTGGWEGSERVANAFDSAADRLGTILMTQETSNG